MGYVFDALNKSRGDGEPDKDDQSFRLATGAVGDQSGGADEQAPAEPEHDQPAPATDDQPTGQDPEPSAGDEIQASNPELVDLTGDTIPDPTPPSAWAVADDQTPTQDDAPQDGQTETDDTESDELDEASLESALAQAMDQAMEIGDQIEGFNDDPASEASPGPQALSEDSSQPADALDELAEQTETGASDADEPPLAEEATAAEFEDLKPSIEQASDLQPPEDDSAIEAGEQLSESDQAPTGQVNGATEPGSAPAYVFTPLVAQQDQHAHGLDDDFAGSESQPDEATSQATTEDPDPHGAPRPIIPIAGLDDRLVALLNPASVMAEEYRAVRTRLLARWQHRRNLIHTITSAVPKEGKTLTSLNLCATFSEMADRRVVVIECDLRIPMFRKMLKLPPSAGLIQVLRGEARLDEAFSPTSRENLKVIAAGGVADDDATQMLSSPQFPAILAQLRHQFDHVIIDTPPVLELADAGIVGAQSDDVLLVVRMNRTPRHMVDEAINLLNGYQAPVTGAVLTDMHFTASGGNYGYRYGYRYSSRYSYKSRHGYRTRRERMSA